MNKIPMTSEGYTKLQNELSKLTTEDRPNIIELLLKQEDMGIYLKMLNINMQKNNRV